MAGGQLGAASVALPLREHLLQGGRPLGLARREVGVLEGIAARRS